MKKLSIIVLTFAVFLLACCGGIDYSKLEKDLGDAATKYYEDNIKGYITGINTHKVTIAALEEAKMDVSKYIDAKCNKEDSYVLIKLELDDEGKQKGEHETEVHLTCDKYTTPAK